MSETYITEGRHQQSQSSDSQSRHNRNANGTQITTSSSAREGEDTEAQIRGHDYAQDAGSDDDSDDDVDRTSDEGDDDRHSFSSLDSIEEQWHLLDEEVTVLVADVHDLALYSKLNITGFMKILKVRDSYHCIASSPIKN